MPDYIQDPNNPKKQIPGPPTDKHSDRATNPLTASFTKTPHYVIVNTTPGLPIGFYLGTSASFATKAVAEDITNGIRMSGSSNYVSFGTPAGGTTLDISPIAWSGSAADNDANCITFIYRGGLDGLGRP